MDSDVYFSIVPDVFW